MNKNTWIEIHAICGDCGRRIKEVLDCEKIDLKSCLRMVKLYHEKYNMACKKCVLTKEEYKL